MRIFFLIRSAGSRPCRRLSTFHFRGFRSVLPILSSSYHNRPPSSLNPKTALTKSSKSRGGETRHFSALRHLPLEASRTPLRRKIMISAVVGIRYGRTSLSLRKTPSRSFPNLFSPSVFSPLILGSKTSHAV